MKVIIKAVLTERGIRYIAYRTKLCLAWEYLCPPNREWDIYFRELNQAILTAHVNYGEAVNIKYKMG